MLHTITRLGNLMDRVGRDRQRRSSRRGTYRSRRLDRSVSEDDLMTVNSILVEAGTRLSDIMSG